MRPALLWLRTLVILATVLLTMGKGAWALTSADQFDQTEAVDTWCCQQEELAELTEAEQLFITRELLFGGPQGAPSSRNGAPGS